jgi:hypothetical protein
MTFRREATPQHVGRPVAHASMKELKSDKVTMIIETVFTLVFFVT